jgi:UDP-2,3-diacylglucosamine hydrolase
MMRLAMIAGGGSLPRAVAMAYQDVYVIGVKGSTIVDVNVDAWIALGQVGRLLTLLKKHKITHLVMAGSVQRPHVASLRLDREGVRLVQKVLFARKEGLGDDKILRFVINRIEEDKITVVGVHTLVPRLLLSMGSLGGVSPNAAQHEDIILGFQAAKLLGRVDIGQSVVVQGGRVMGVEGVEGTDGLLSRLTRWLDGTAVLVKVSKPNQETRVDMPSLGMQTIIQAHKAGCIGVAGEAGQCLVIDADDMVRQAQKMGMFIYGINSVAT